QEHGFDGLIDRPPIPKSFPTETPVEVREQVIALSLEHPAWGPGSVSDIGGL
ncbi:MAG: helix-turn-helix domain-containing protein, partial [Deltaproteobacteria bacterium]|nr:helix-turn-helix domain-containing protein [Deltaproteobacteria bacterium]